MRKDVAYWSQRCTGKDILEEQKKHQSCHRFQKDGRELKQRCLIQYGIEEAGFVCKDEICPRCEGSEELEEKEVL